MPPSSRSFKTASVKTASKPATKAGAKAASQTAAGAGETETGAGFDTNDAPESAVQRRMVRLLLQKGYRVVRVNSGAMKVGSGFFRAYIIHGLFGARGQEASAGFPDLLVLCSLEAYLRGLGAWSEAVAETLQSAGVDAQCCNVAHLIEVKKVGGQLRPAQKKCIEYFSLYDVRTLPCLSWDDAERVANELPDLRPHLDARAAPLSGALDGFKSPRQKRNASAKAGFGKP